MARTKKSTKARKSTKTKARKATKTSTRRRRQATGVVELTDREKKVLGTLVAAGGNKLTIAEIAEVAFPSKSKEKGNSWTRNQLRRLRDRLKLVKKVGRGTYAATAKALEEHAQATVADRAPEPATTEGSTPQPAPAPAETAQAEPVKTEEPAAQTEAAPSVSATGS